MSRICNNNDSADFLLYFVIGFKDALLPFNDRKNTVIITRDTTKIHWNNHFCFFCDYFLQRIIVHLKRIFLTIHKYELCTHMTNNRCRGGICISSRDDFIAFTDSKNTQCGFSTGRLRIQAYTFRCTNPFSNLLFQQLCLWTCGNPSRAKYVSYFCDFRFRDIRRRKRDIHFIFSIKCMTHILYLCIKSIKNAVIFHCYIGTEVLTSYPFLTDAVIIITLPANQSSYSLHRVASTAYT